MIRYHSRRRARAGWGGGGVVGGGFRDTGVQDNGVVIIASKILACETLRS